MAARNDVRTMQCVRMRRQIGAAHDAAGDEMQVDAEERRIFVVHLTAGSCWVAGVGKLSDSVNLDDIESTRGVPHQAVGVADRG